MAECVVRANEGDVTQAEFFVEIFAERVADLAR